MCIVHVRTRVLFTKVFILKKLDEKMSQENNETCIMDASDMNENEREVMKGDNVGDTAYSAKWILTTLIALSKNVEGSLSEDLENELGILWDMTVDKDVVNFLLDNNFLSLANVTLVTSQEPRLTEIIVGIIGNICAQPDALPIIADTTELVNELLLLLNSDDTQTLLQVVRVLQAALWDIQRDYSTKWRENLVNCEFIGERLIFILQYSVNDELLRAVLNFLHSICETEHPHDDDGTSLWQEIFKTKLLFVPLVESFNQLIPSKNVCLTTKEREVMNNWLNVLSYILHKSQQPVNVDNHDEIIDILIRILERNEGNLNPLEEYTASWIYECVAIIHWFQQKKYQVKVKAVCVTVAIMTKLNSLQAANPDNETVNELLKYLEKYIIG